jgi:hypothetical protein
MHHPFVPLNSQPFINVKPQLNIFVILLNNAHVGPFLLPIMLAPIVAHDQLPNLPPFSQHAYDFHLEAFTSFIGVNLPFNG